MEEKIKELEKQIAELKAELEKETEFRLNKGDDYYYIGRYEENNDSTDDYLYDIGNYFKSEEEALKEAKKLKAITKVTRAIDKANGDWKPDWKNPYQDKFQIALNPAEIGIASVCYWNCKQALSIPYIKDLEIAKKIIEEYEEELRTIFDIEE